MLSHILQCAFESVRNGAFMPALCAFFTAMEVTCCSVQTRQVRQSAAENLGELTRMSMRVDQLATDLINNAKMADPAIQEAYLTALRGMLLSTGQRLSPPVLSKAGEALQSMMSAAGTCCVFLSSLYSLSLNDLLLRNHLCACFVDV